jgi:ABC-type Mn2+/Zn2+ transport system ATPase subunit
MKPEEKYDRIIEILNSIELGKLIILTGGNATGKSLIRRVLWASLKKLKDDGRKPGQYVADTSMERRTSSHPGLGALSGIFNDDPWVATSECSLRGIENIIKLDDRFIVLDEPEIGCSLELQAGIAKMLNERKSEILEKNLGILVITHSKVLVERLDSDMFFNMEGMMKEEWLNREIVPIDIDTFKQEANETFRFMQDVLKTQKQ